MAKLLYCVDNLNIHTHWTDFNYSFATRSIFIISIFDFFCSISLYLSIKALDKSFDF